MTNIKSKSERFLENRSTVPAVSALMASSVSEFRREKLAGEVESGFYRDGSGPSIKNGEHTSNGIVSASVGINKIAQVTSSVTSSNYRGTNSNTVKQTPEVYSPLWLDSNLSLPRDRATINAWCRSFFALNPFVQNAINLHSTYPISKLNIKCPHKEIEKFFNDMIEETDLMNVCVQIAQEYWLLGEAFVYGEIDEINGKWSRFVIQNPDYMVVKRTMIANEPVIQLRPDENLKTIVRSNKPSDIEQRKQLNQFIIDSVRAGGNITLDNLQVSHIARRISPYEIRGTGLPVCIFRQLMLFDRLRESKFAQAGNMINPLTLVKIGSAEFKPSVADIEAFRDIFETAQYDRDFKLFTHDGVTVEKIGSGAGIYDISADITQLVKEIYVGLQVPQVLMDGGADTTYANGGVALDTLRQRYMQFRNMMAQWLKRKVFAPISQMQEFYDYSGGEKQLIIPEIDWNHMSLFDAGDYINTLVQLTQGEGEQKRASLHTLYRSMGLEFEDESRKMRKEAIQAAIQKREKAALDAMDLNSLRALDEDDEIPEPDAAEVAAAAVPGESSGSLPGMPGMPDMGTPPPDMGGAGAPPPPSAPPPA
jgi:hypothetical protein